MELYRGNRGAQYSENVRVPAILEAQWAIQAQWKFWWRADDWNGERGKEPLPWMNSKPMEAGRETFRINGRSHCGRRPETLAKRPHWLKSKSTWTRAFAGACLNLGPLRGALGRNITSRPLWADKGGARGKAGAFYKSCGCCQQTSVCLACQAGRGRSFLSRFPLRTGAMARIPHHRFAFPLGNAAAIDAAIEVPRRFGYCFARADEA